MKKRILHSLPMLIVILVSLALLQRLLVPKYADHVIEGNFIAEYYEETTTHDVIILGDCEVYQNISPVTLWEEYGITSFIRGSAQQLIPQSYYLLEDTLLNETPRVVILSVSAMQEENQVSEAYNRMTMDGMRWSKSKYQAIMDTKMEDEYLVDYLFPVLRFHSRWQELKEDDFEYFLDRPRVSHNGFFMRSEVVPMTEFPTERRKSNYTFSDKSYDYLNRITKLCKEKGIQLVLMKSPSLYPSWYEQWDQQIQDFAKVNDLIYINYLQELDEIGLDFNTDSFNGGQHLNVAGAEKFSLYLGEWLQREAALPDHREDPLYQKVWEDKIGFYENMKQEQQTELDQFGYLKKFKVE